MSQTSPNGKRYYKREWLNLPGFHTIAYVYADIDEPTAYEEGMTYVPYVPSAYLTIGDCSRAITLTFEVDSESVPNTLHKLDLLESTLRDFRQQIQDLIVLAAKHEELRKSIERKPRRRTLFHELLNDDDRNDQTTDAGTGSGTEASEAGGAGSK